MGAEYIPYVKFIATEGPTFFGYIILVLASVRKKYQIRHQKVFGPMMYICGVRFATHLSRKSEIVMCEHSGSRLELNRAFHSNVCSSQLS